MNGRRCYVGNIPYAATKAQIEALFGEIGPLREVRVMTDRETGRPKGFAFVEFEHEQDAQAACDELNQTEFGGRPLTVNIARERERSGRGGR